VDLIRANTYVSNTVLGQIGCGSRYCVEDANGCDILRLPSGKHLHIYGNQHF